MSPRILARHPIAGGDLNDAYRVKLADGRRAFLKTRSGAQPGEYAAEAAGLRWLGEAGGLRVPGVIAVADDHLLLEWIDTGRLSAAGEEELGRGLATTHAAGAPAFGGAAPQDPTVGDGGGAEGARSVAPVMRLGPLTLPSPPAETWARFYAEHRLAPLIPRAGLTGSGRRAVEAVCERIGELAGPPEAPARLHGDCWSGNVLAGADGRPWLVDPAPYGGHREVDLAMLRLFGAPAPRTLAAYAERAPLADGHEERLALWQLFPLLVHAVLFGGSYVAAAERAARAYA